ncbi:Zinc finger, GRF-type [Sesbania bispinosa]|nr:Zinc finger, GRF-type [Sesbania bispinosa]
MMGGGAEVPQSRMHRRNNNGSRSTSSVSMGSVVRLCHCGSKAAIRTSKTERNLGRPFYSCPLPKDHSQNCSYFCWIDEIVEDSAKNGDNLEVWRKSQLILKMDSLINGSYICQEVYDRNGMYHVYHVFVGVDCFGLLSSVGYVK